MYLNIFVSSNESEYRRKFYKKIDFILNKRGIWVCDKGYSFKNDTESKILRIGFEGRKEYQQFSYGDKNLDLIKMMLPLVIAHEAKDSIKRRVK